jgi:hypothetical protein
MRPLRWFVAAGVVMLGVGSEAAGAVAPDAAAWWYKPYISSSPAPPPSPNVPSGGLYVEQDATSQLPATPVPSGLPATVPNVAGPTAFAALRFTVARESPATLVLKVATGSTTTNADIVACPTIATWQPPTGGGPGPYDKGPSYNCIHPVKATIAGAQMSWQLPTSMQFVSGTYDIALVPNPSNKSVFSVAFDPPDSSSVVSSPAAAPGLVEASAPVASSPSTFTPAASTPAALPLSAASLAAPLAEPAAAPAIAAQPPGTVALGYPSFRAGRPASHIPIDQSHRQLAVGLLLAIAVAWWYVGGQSARAPRLLGATAGRADTVTPPFGGIGRFARPRTGPARRLR